MTKKAKIGKPKLIMVILAARNKSEILNAMYFSLNHTSPMHLISISRTYLQLKLNSQFNVHHLMHSIPIKLAKRANRNNNQSTVR